MLAGPGARRALLDGRVGAVELVLRGGAYVTLDGDWMMLAEPTAPFGPLSLAVHGLERLALSPGLPARVTGSRLVLGEHAISLERMRQGGMAPLAIGPPARRHAMVIAAKAALAALPAPPVLLRAGIAALALGRLRDAAYALAGLGEGLTPAGDDVLTGYAAARTALGAVHEPANGALDSPELLSTLAAGRSSPIGLAYLRCGERGELPDAGARLLGAIRRGSPAAVRTALPALRAWGASSGVALVWGIVTPVTGSIPVDGDWFESTPSYATTGRTPAKGT